MLADVFLLLQNDVRHDVGRCNLVLTLERRYIYKKMFATQSNYWRIFFSAMADSWKKLKPSNMFSPFIVCLNRNRSAI